MPLQLNINSFHSFIPLIRTLKTCHSLEFLIYKMHSTLNLCEICCASWFPKSLWDLMGLLWEYSKCWLMSLQDLYQLFFKSHGNLKRTQLTGSWQTSAFAIACYVLLYLLILQIRQCPRDQRYQHCFLNIKSES